jgi:hypothetical protein
MARIVARNAALHVEDNTGACTSVSGRANTIALSWTSEAPEVTSFTETTRTRVPGGLMDWELTADIFYDEAAGNVDALFSGLMGGSGTKIFFGPAGSTATNVKYSGSAVLTEYSMNFAVADAGTANVSFAARTGALTRGTYP